MSKSVLNKKEFIFVVMLSLALGIRQMAMTLVMPFISTYSKTLAYNTYALAGVALGIFGLAQAIFQIPYGIWSDKIGRKLVILIGLMQVIIGLVIAYLAKDIYTLIFARALQGSGAVLGVGYSWIGGGISEDKRVRALSITGMLIGLFAVLSFALGPIIHQFLSLKNMFLICAVLIFITWIYILIFIKEDKNFYKEQNNFNLKNSFKVLLKNTIFIKLNIAGFINNFIMASVFYLVPMYLENITGSNGMWKVFMPSVIIAIICMRIATNFVEKGYSYLMLKLAFCITTIGICCYFKNLSFAFILIGSIFFMIGYICLSTIISSNANDIADENNRGTANGIINSFQYIGSFVGSVLTGIMWGTSQSFVLWLIISISILGIIIISSCKNVNEFSDNSKAIIDSNKN